LIPSTSTKTFYNFGVWELWLIIFQTCWLFVHSENTNPGKVHLSAPYRLCREPLIVPSSQLRSYATCARPRSSVEPHAMFPLKHPYPRLLLLPLSSLPLPLLRFTGRPKCRFRPRGSPPRYLLGSPSSRAPPLLLHRRAELYLRFVKNTHWALFVLFITAVLRCVSLLLQRSFVLRHCLQQRAESATAPSFVPPRRPVPTACDASCRPRRASLRTAICEELRRESPSSPSVVPSRRAPGSGLRHLLPNLAVRPTRAPIECRSRTRLPSRAATGARPRRVHHLFELPLSASVAINPHRSEPPDAIPSTRARSSGAVRTAISFDRPPEHPTPELCQAAATPRHHRAGALSPLAIRPTRRLRWDLLARSAPPRRWVAATGNTAMPPDSLPSVAVQPYGQPKAKGPASHDRPSCARAHLGLWPTQLPKPVGQISARGAKLFFSFRI
jgi:hypothetical protein